MRQLLPAPHVPALLLLERSALLLLLPARLSLPEHVAEVRLDVAPKRPAGQSWQPRVRRDWKEPAGHDRRKEPSTDGVAAG